MCTASVSLPLSVGRETAESSCAEKVKITLHLYLKLKMEHQIYVSGETEEITDVHHIRCVGECCVCHLPAGTCDKF
jgi:hypothetical protein